MCPQKAQGFKSKNMSSYSKEADIEKAVAVFTEEYFNCTRVRKMAREWRYDLGESTRIAILDMDKCICKGWESSVPERKQEYYEEAAGLLLHIQHNLNRMNDLCVLDNVTKAKLDILSLNIKKQLLGMTNSMRRKLAKRQSGGEHDSTDSELDN